MIVTCNLELKSFLATVLKEQCLSTENETY